ncbi:MAG TPA: S8 family serine peptidase [Thermoanaerobaculia bacterium]
MIRRLLLIALFATAAAAEPRRYIVEYGPTARQRFRSEAAEVAVVHHEFSRVFHGAAVELRDGQSAADLARLPNVVAVHPDTEVVAFSTIAGNGSPANRQPRTANNARGDGIVVAVIDTGIDGTHPALAGKVIGGYDFVDNDGDPMDDHGHGTHVAGIIAAEGGTMTGVAPGVRLLAYKVLNAEGRGMTSGVIAAIERALDPNGDGNFSDRADIANLSLGDRGRPDGPLAQAVDRAVAAGMVVCAAAGNDGAFHRIGSPAGAARAITVGASGIEEGTTVLAYFSSRGPATGNAAIKPDVIAPGQRIVSTWLHHGYNEASGTSMATPYVAGLAALLLEEHPGWTPDRVKSALATTARAVDGEEVMAQGTGVPDLLLARVNTLVASPSHVSFGLDSVTSATWASTRSITLRNDGDAPRTVHASVPGAPEGIHLQVTPAEATLAPGQSLELTLAIDVDHATLGSPRTASLAFGGTLVVESGGETLRLPWAFVRAARATIRPEGDEPRILWSSEQPRYASPVPIGGGAMELLLEPGQFDFVVVTGKQDELRMVVVEQQQVTGDLDFAVTDADAPHEIRFSAVDERGTPFPDGDGTSTLRSLLLRLSLPGQRTAALPDVRARKIRTSPFSDRFGLLAIEAFVDRNGGRVYVAQHAPLGNVTSDRTLTIAPGDYAAQEVSLRFPQSGTRREVQIMPRDWPRNRMEHRLPAPPSLRFAAGGPEWNGTLFLTKEVHEDAAGGVQLALYTDGDPHAPAALITPVIRRNGHGFFAGWGFAESILPMRAMPGEALAFGDGAMHVPGPITAFPEGLVGDGEVYGNRGDRRRSDTLTGMVRVRDDSGAEVGSGPVTPQSFFLPLPRTGRFTAEIHYAGGASLAMRFDTRQGIDTLPAVTSLAILDGTGRHATTLPANGNGALLFSAADYEGGEYRRIAAGATKVFFRRRGTETWSPLTAVATGDEETSNDHFRWPAGMLFRAELNDVLRNGPGEYELAIEVADEKGNTTRWQTGSAFRVEGVSAGKRRAVRP